MTVAELQTDQEADRITRFRELLGAAGLRPHIYRTWGPSDDSANPGCEIAIFTDSGGTAMTARLWPHGECTIEEGWS
jgi:hypothetical protein